MSTKKALWVSLGAATVIGVAAYFIANDEESRESIASFINRQKVKFFVREKLNGNNKAMELVDKLSDDDINRLMKVLETSKDWKESIVNTLDDVKNKSIGVKEKAMGEDWLDKAVKVAEKYLG
ncbi:hypothetical protein [Atopobacter phocae]|uniref:hypothetical protein n=1 Tax=Atopobacter phocae TaxID=136492 RepID=UPI00047107A0|nr:hypothetical protein [Atopobacter phocae]